MTKKRKSFVLHKDSLAILPDLTDEQAGKLFKAIYAYQINEEIKLDQIIKMVFLPFKNQFIRDDEKYTETCERRAIAGSKGGKQKVANASKSKQKQANLAESKNKSKNDSDSKSDNDNKQKRKVKTLLPRDFSISKEMFDWFHEQRFFIGITDATDKWIDAMKAGGYKYIDWQAAWRNGMKKANEWNLQKNNHQPNKPRAFSQ